MFGTVLACFYRRWNIWFLFVDMLSRFEVTRFRLTAGWRKLSKIWSSPAKFLGSGVKNFAGRFQAWLHTKLVQIFGDPFREAWDSLSRNLEPKSTTDRPTDQPTNEEKKVLRKNR